MMSRRSPGDVGSVGSNDGDVPKRGICFGRAKVMARIAAKRSEGPEFNSDESVSDSGDGPNRIYTGRSLILRGVNYGPSARDPCASKVTCQKTQDQDVSSSSEDVGTIVMQSQLVTTTSEPNLNLQSPVRRPLDRSVRSVPDNNEAVPATTINFVKKSFGVMPRPARLPIGRPNSSSPRDTKEGSMVVRLGGGWKHVDQSYLDLLSQNRNVEKEEYWD